MRGSSLAGELELRIELRPARYKGHRLPNGDPASRQGSIKRTDRDIAPPRFNRL
jgi:hypothetical protein